MRVSTLSHLRLFPMHCICFSTEYFSYMSFCHECVYECTHFSDVIMLLFSCCQTVCHWLSLFSCSLQYIMYETLILRFICVCVTDRKRLFVWYVGMQVSADSEWCTTCKCDRRRGKIALHLTYESSHTCLSFLQKTNVHTRNKPSLLHKHINYITRFMTGLVFIFTWCSGTVLFW